MFQLKSLFIEQHIFSWHCYEPATIHWAAEMAGAKQSACCHDAYRLFEEIISETEM